MRKMAFTIALMFLISACIVSACAGDSWVCPKCGRTGNTGNFCGNCANPSPTPKPTPEPTDNLSGKPLLFSEGAAKIVPTLVSMCNDAKKWTKNTAPKSAKKLPLLPDHWAEIAKWIKNLKFTLKKNGDHYEIKANQKDTYQILTNLNCTVFFENEEGSGSGVNTERIADGVYSFPVSEAEKAQKAVNYTKNINRFMVWFDIPRSQDTRDWQEEIIIMYRNRVSGMASYEYGVSINYRLFAKNCAATWDYDGKNDYNITLGTGNMNNYTLHTWLNYNATSGYFKSINHY